LGLSAGFFSRGGTAYLPGSGAVALTWKRKPWNSMASTGFLISDSRRGWPGRRSFFDGVAQVQDQVHAAVLVPLLGVVVVEARAIASEGLHAQLVRVGPAFQEEAVHGQGAVQGEPPGEVRNLGLPLGAVFRAQFVAQGGGVSGHEHRMGHLLDHRQGALEQGAAVGGEFGGAGGEEGVALDGEHLDHLVGLEAQVGPGFFPEHVLERFEVLDALHGAGLHGAAVVGAGQNLGAAVQEAHAAEDRAQHHEFARLVDLGHAHQEHEEGQHERDAVPVGQHPQGDVLALGGLFLPGAGHGPPNPTSCAPWEPGSC
jgi:hypothetical protein